MATTNYSWNLPTVGGSEDTWGASLNSNWSALDTLLGGTSATEFAILDGATVTTAELNILDGVTATTAELNILGGVTSTAAEINLLDGVTWTLADYNTLTATAAELNVLDGITGIASQAEAEAGTATDKLMTPERTNQAIQALVSGGIGDGQTWQLPSRSAGVSYQNTTGSPIQVAITYHSVNNDNAPAYTFQVSQNNSTWVTISRQGERWTNHSHFAIVPNGYYYKQSGWNNSGGGSIIWAELR